MVDIDLYPPVNSIFIKIVKSQGGVHFQTIC
jgi:hypothetical protein